MRRRPREGASRPAELPLPAVRVGERIGLARVVGGEARERAEALTLGRGRLDRPRQASERPPGRVRAARRPGRRAHRRPPRTGSPRAGEPSSRRGLAHEREQPAWARAGGVEEVAVATRRVGPLRAGRRAYRRARGASRRRRTATWAPGAGASPARARSRTPPRSVRVRARARSRTATRPGAPAASPRTVARSRAVRMSSRRDRDARRRRAARSSSITRGRRRAARRSRCAAIVAGARRARRRCAASPRATAARSVQRVDPPRRAAPASAAGAPSAASSSPRSSVRPGARPGREGAPRESRRRRDRARRTACGGTRRARVACRCSTRTGAGTAATARTAVVPSLVRPSTANGTPSAPNAVSIDARDALERRADDRDAPPARPRRGRDRAPSRRRARASLAGRPPRGIGSSRRARPRDAPVVEEVALEVRDPAGRYACEPAGSSTISSGCQRRRGRSPSADSEANTARPGSYGSET